MTSRIIDATCKCVQDECTCDVIEPTSLANKHNPEGVYANELHPCAFCDHYCNSLMNCKYTKMREDSKHCYNCHENRQCTN